MVLGTVGNVFCRLCFVGLCPVVAASVRPGGTRVTTATPGALRLGHLQAQAAVADVQSFQRREGVFGVLHRAEVEEREAGLAAPDHPPCTLR